MRAVSFAFLLALSGLAAGEAKAPGKVVRITAKKFEFNPSEIHLKAGEPVVFEVTALDRTHGFSIPKLKLRVDVTTSAVATVAFTPVEPGTFTFQCDLFCGLHHEDMNGTLYIEK